MSVSTKTIQIALIGCGGIAQTHLEAMSRVGRLQLHSIQDVRPEAALEASKKFNCAAAKNLQEIVGNPEIDAVIICAPPVYHFEIMKQMISAGKHVLCEKPFTISLDEAQKIQEMAKKSDRLVMMASKFRFVEDVIEARKIVQSGIIGEVILSEVIFCSIVDMTRRWNSNPAIAGGGALIDNGSHAVDVIRYLVGPIQSVYAQAGKRTQDIKVEDTARLHFETDNHIIGMVDLSWSLYKHTPTYVNILGTLGSIEVGWAQSQVRSPHK